MARKTMGKKGSIKKIKYGRTLAMKNGDSEKIRKRAAKSCMGWWSIKKDNFALLKLEEASKEITRQQLSCRTQTWVLYMKYWKFTLIQKII